MRPSFLRTTAAKKPRTECCCQPVVFMIVAIVAPLGWLSSAITVACLEVARAVATPAAFGCGVFVAGGLVVGRALAFLLILLLGMSGFLSSLRRHLAPSPPKPRRGGVASGAGSPARPQPRQDPHTSALLARECQSFLR